MKKALEKVQISERRYIYKISDKGKEIVDFSKSMQDIYFPSVDTESQRFYK
jgi:hypothetical protein